MINKRLNKDMIRRGMINMKNIRAIVGVAIGCAVVSGGVSYAHLKPANTQKTSSSNVKLLSKSDKANNATTTMKVSIINASNLAVNQAMKTNITKNNISNPAVTAAIKTGKINIENNIANEYFLENSSYSGKQNYTSNIKINYNKNTNTISEYSLNNPNKVYILKLTSSIIQIGIQLNKYDNGELIGRYNLIYGQGEWSGTYTELAPTANIVSNVAIRAN